MKWYDDAFFHCVKSIRIWSYSGPHFPAFGLNTERYGVSRRARITPNTCTIHAVLTIQLNHHLVKLLPLPMTGKKVYSFIRKFGKKGSCIFMLSLNTLEIKELSHWQNVKNITFTRVILFNSSHRLSRRELKAAGRGGVHMSKIKGIYPGP